MALTRRAILIESSNVAGLTDLPGARIDVENWSAFLRSRAGGAWSDSEISILRKPKWVQLKRILDQNQATDYVFITFSGHGDHVRARDLDETRVCLNEDDDVLVASMNPGNPRCSFVVDSCRGLVVDEEIVEEAVAVHLGVRKEAASNYEYRRLFDDAVQHCEKGIAHLYACDIGENADESRRSGGYFSRYLVDCATEWHRQVDPGNRQYYPLDQAHSCASGRTTRRRPQQHPQYEGGRRRHHFPIAVCP